MNIVVCLKQVPKKDSILRIGADQKWIDERDLSYEMSEADAYALEEALRQKEKHGGEVVVISLGPERVRQSIKEALAKGADRAIHLHDLIFDTATDALAIARALLSNLRLCSTDTTRANRQPPRGHHKPIAIVGASKPLGPLGGSGAGLHGLPVGGAELAMISSLRALDADELK